MMESVTKWLGTPCHFENTRMPSMWDDVFFSSLLSVIYHSPKFFMESGTVVTNQ